MGVESTFVCTLARVIANGNSVFEELQMTQS